METDKTTSLQHSSDQQEIIQRLTEENQFLKERINLLLAQLYGKKSEKQSVFPTPDQISFFDNSGDDSASTPDPQPEQTDVPAHTRKKAGRKPLPAELPRVDVVHDIPDDQKQCACGTGLSRIGEEVSEQLNYVPARLEVIRHIRPKYACKACEGIETEGATVKIAPVPKQIIEKSIASPGLLAHIITAKFVDALPFYRQEKQFARLGYEISRSNMTNWTIQLGQSIEKLLGLLKADILSGPLIQMDETTLQVLKETGRAPTSKSHMWVMRGGPSKKPGIYFHYNPSRGSTVAQNLLKTDTATYQGVVQTDGYTGYDFLDNDPDIQHAGCWAHARRKFTDVLKAKGKYDKKKAKSGHAEQAVDFISQLYGIEHQADKEELSPKQRLALRQKEARPVLDEFHKWLTATGLKTPPKGLLGKAIGYTLSRWDQLTQYVNFSFLTPDNNLAENAIRPFVVGRKNWLCVSRRLYLPRRRYDHALQWMRAGPSQRDYRITLQTT